MSENQEVNPEQALKEAHAKAFAERPEDFVDMRTIVIAVQRKGAGDVSLNTFVSPATRNELILSVAEITRVVNKVIDYNEMVAAKEVQGRIVPAKPTFTNRVKGAFGRK